ncbi:hypothetical protein A9Q79_09870 [Methylophaga sp. 42_25_T18]|nr:hypothetical protein A9Q79_09870 [Methylophaga sp. 42_25_T18]OUR89937.1 hypothetical protein A9Q92_00035 [Methylophaga sp. 42_8_T64]
MNKPIIVVLIALLTLVGCRQEITSTLYVTDIVDTVSSKKSMTAAAIKLGMPSSKSCGEKKEKLTRVISPFFINLEKIQCLKEGSNSFYYGIFELPLLNVADDGNLNQDYKGGISAQLSKNKENIDIYLAMKLELVSALDKDLRSEFMAGGGINPEDMTVKIAINNDDREPYNLFVEGAFLDGQPIIPRFGQTVKLKRRSESVISLANVSLFALTGRGKTSFAYVGSISPY